MNKMLYVNKPNCERVGLLCDRLYRPWGANSKLSSLSSGGDCLGSLVNSVKANTNTTDFTGKYHDAGSLYICHQRSFDNADE